MWGNGDDELGSAVIDSYGALVSGDVDTLVFGGVVISYYLEGEPKIDHDIDHFIREHDVERAMRLMTSAGFEVTRTHPTWLFKGRRNGATVDVLYRLGRILKLDDEMIDRAVETKLGVVPMRFISRDDLAVGQAGAAKPEVPGHWFQAIDLLQSAETDWDYVARRSAVAPDLRSALLHYAKHPGIHVPQNLLSALG